MILLVLNGIQKLHSLTFLLFVLFAWSSQANAQSTCIITGESEACVADELLYLVTDTTTHASVEWDIVGGHVVSQDGDSATVYWQQSGQNMVIVDLLDNMGNVVAHCSYNVLVKQDYDIDIGIDTIECDEESLIPKSDFHNCEHSHRIYSVLNSDIPPDATYSWRVTDTTVLLLGTNGNSTISVDHLKVGTTNLCVDVTVDGCISTKCVEIRVVDNPVAHFILSPDSLARSFCKGQELHFINTTESTKNCDSYLWELLKNDTVIDNHTKRDWD